MAALGQTFDASTVEPRGDFEVLPADTYVVQIDASEMQPTKDGNGQYLKLELTVIEGDYAGRKLFDRLNLVNQNATAQRIAEQTLSAICHATGQMQVEDSEQLHHLPMLAVVKVRPARKAADGKDYGPSNEVGTYKPLDAAQAPRAQTTPAQQRTAAAPVVRQQTAPAANPAGATRPTAPWRRG